MTVTSAFSLSSRICPELRSDAAVVKSISLPLPFSFRRQRARERQQKLLAEFASRQKSFMETAMDVGKKTTSS